MEVSLTDQQKHDVKESWTKLMEKMDSLDAGMSMFMKLFELEPSLKSYFRFSTDNRNLQLKLHVRAVMATLDRCIKNLDSWRNVESNFQQLGTMHAAMGVEKNQILKLADSFLWMMENSLEDDYTENRRESCMCVTRIVCHGMSSSVCPRPMVQTSSKEPNTDCALGKKLRKMDDNDVSKGVIQSTNPPSGLESTGPLPNEIFELLNEFWRPNDLLPPEQHMMNGKRRNMESPNGDEQIEDDKDVEDDLTSIAEQEQDVTQDRNTSKRRYSRLSDGYERLKTVLPSVKDKRRVSKARILDEAINYIQRLESITNVLKREHEKRLQMLNGSANGFFADYSVQPPYMRSIYPKQMYHQGMTSKITPYTKMNGAVQSPSKATPRLKQSYQYSGTGVQGLGTNTAISPDYNYQSLNAYSNNNNNSIYTNDPSQMISDEASPIANTSPYNNSACSLSPGTPTSYQNGTVNNSWPYHQASMNNFTDTTSTQLLSHAQNRQGSAGYGSNNTYATLTNGMWNGMGMGESSSQVVPHGEHSMKVG